MKHEMAFRTSIIINLTKSEINFIIKNWELLDIIFKSQARINVVVAQNDGCEVVVRLLSIFTENSMWTCQKTNADNNNNKSSGIRNRRYFILFYWMNEKFSVSFNLRTRKIIWCVSEKNLTTFSKNKLDIFYF